MGQPTSTQRDTSASASASSSSSSSALTPRGADVQKSFAIKSRGLQVLLDQQELEPGHINLSQIKASSASASASASASSSSSSASTPNGPYQVFINHRGPDVKKSFASFLYRELKSRGLQVFLDQPELAPGHLIPSQIKAAIQSASVQIAIFSKTYAESKWCLDELVHMLETTRRDTISQRATILPVFYEVKPSELRRTDRGAYANAMRKHKQRSRNGRRLFLMLQG